MLGNVHLHQPPQLVLGPPTLVVGLALTVGGGAALVSNFLADLEKPARSVQLHRGQVREVEEYGAVRFRLGAFDSEFAPSDLKKKERNKQITRSPGASLQTSPRCD